jgi:MFS superfamily sulfate permease-like transporter
MAPGLQLYDTGRGKNEARRIAPNRCRRYNRTSSKPRKRKPDEEIVEVSVPVLGAIPGIGLAVAIAIIEFLWDGWRPHSAVLGRAEGVKGYHDITRYPNVRQIPGLVLFRWDAPSFFANAEFFKERILDAATKSPSPVRWVVVAAEPVTSVDATAADTLTDLANTTSTSE